MWTNGLALISYTRLQASGRPDLVTWVQFAEIPPYIGLLYLGLHFGGLPGAGARHLDPSRGGFRHLDDTGPEAPRRAWYAVAASSILLVAAVWFATLWDISNWRWWGVCRPSGDRHAGCWASAPLPADVKSQIQVLLQRYAGRWRPGRGPRLTGSVAVRARSAGHSFPVSEVRDGPNVRSPLLEA